MEAQATRETTNYKRTRAGDVIVLACCGPMGTGMEETYQLTSALKSLPCGKHVALVTGARFSGISTGTCIGHAGPEALTGGPIGRSATGIMSTTKSTARRSPAVSMSSEAPVPP